MRIFCLSIFLALGLSLALGAQNKVPSYDAPFQWGVGAGLNFGATPPLPIPRAVTQVHAWYPNLNPAVKIWGLYRFSERLPLSLSLGVEAERKSFSATTMLTGLEIALPGGDMQGNFTGNQNVSIDNTYLTLPIGINWDLARGRLHLRLEGYASLLTSAKFAVKLDGDGKLNDEPLAEGEILYFNFGDQIRNYDLGLRLAAKYYFTHHWGVETQMSYGITPATKRDFRSMFPYGLHHLYAQIGLSYRFR